MTNIRKLIGKLAEQEARLRETTFLAPCVPGGSVRTRVAGLVYTFAPVPPDGEGWGLFKPLDAERAERVGKPTLMQVDAYLKLFPAFRVRLVLRLQHRTWLAYPANTSDAQQRLGQARPVPVHLVEHASVFEQVVARWDGAAWWFEAPDRRDDPRFAAFLREALKEETEPEALQRRDLTPEMRTTYSLAFTRTATYKARMKHQREQARLGEALSFAGGALHDFQDRGDFWLVTWATRDGETHQSAIKKNDLTVMSAGICLDDQDADFDLQSLVSVMEQRPDWM